MQNPPSTIRPLLIERRAILIAHLSERADIEPVPNDLRAVAMGALHAVPLDLKWDTSAQIAHLIHGYELAPAAGHGHLQDFCNLRRRLAERHGWSGDLLELWLNLFSEHRRQRHAGGYPPKGAELKLLDALCEAFTAAASLS